MHTETQRGADRRLRRVAVWALYATALTPLVFSSGTIYPYVVPRAVFFRVLAAIAAAIGVYLLVSRGPGPDSRVSDGPSGERRPGPPWRDLVFLALGALVVIQVVAALAGEAPIRSLFGDMERMGGVIAWLHFLAFYVAFRAVLTSGEALTFFRIAMVVTVAVTGIAILQTLGLTIGILPGTGEDRAIGTLGNAGYLGIYTVLGIGLAALVWRRSREVWKAPAGIAAAVNATALAFTYTRAALAGLGAGLVIGLLAYGLMAGWRRRRLAVAAAAGLALLIGIGAWGVWGRAQNVGRGADTSGISLLERGLGNRFSAWRAGADALAGDPVTGLGAENFRLAFDWHFAPERFPPQVHYTRAHNDLVESLVAGGIPEGLAWLALWGAVFTVIIRARRDGKLSPADAALLGGALAAYMVYLLFWFHEVNSLHIVLALAAFAGLERRGPYLAEPAGAGRAAGVRATVAVALVLVVGADIAHHGRIVAAGRHLVGGAREPDLDARVAHYERALELRPLGAEEVVTEYVRFSTVLPGAVGERLRDPRTRARVVQVQGAARRSLDELIAEDPRNPRLHREAGRLDVIRYQLSRDPAYLEGAVASLDRAIELAPGRIRYRHMLSEAYLMAERTDDAVRVLEEGLGRYSELGETHYFLAKALLLQGSYPQAARALTRGYELGYRGPSGTVHKALAREFRARGQDAVVRRMHQAWEAAPRRPR